MGRLLRGVFRPWLLVGLSLAVSAWVFGPRLLGPLPDLRARPEYRLRPTAIEITPVPRWAPPDLVAQAASAAELPDELSLLDDDLAETVASALAAHPWVAEVVQVRKSFPARVEVDVRYRRPVAVVMIERAFHPVDGDGTLLPAADFAPADVRRYPNILGVSSPPQGPPGTAWGDLRVAAAARLADALLDLDEGGETWWRRLNLSAIRVASGPSEPASSDDLLLELLSEGGSRIVWGRPPGSDHPGELSAEQKIGRLEKYRRDFGGFDRPHGPYEIDIRHWQEISRRPLVTQRERRETER